MLNIHQEQNVLKLIIKYDPINDNNFLIRNNVVINITQYNNTAKKL